MRRRANNYDAQMAELGYRKEGGSDQYYYKFINNRDIYIYMDEGWWWADVHAFGYTTGEYGPFESPMDADMYVCNVNGFKGGFNMRKRAYGRSVTNEEFIEFERYLMDQYGAAHGARVDATRNGLEEDEAYFEGKADAYSEILTYIDRYLA